MRYAWLIVMITIIISITISIAGIKKGNIQENENINTNVNVDLGTKKFGPYFQLWSTGGYKYNLNVSRNGTPLTQDEIANLVEQYIQQNPNAAGLGDIIAWLRNQGYEVQGSYSWTQEDVKGLAN
ncbi:MAG: hypothetical protein ACK4ZM_03440, partial [bacterium]